MTELYCDDARLLELAWRLVDEALAAGAQEADAYLVDEWTLSLRCLDGKPSSSSEARTRGAGVRVVKAGAVGHAHCSLSDLDRPTPVVRRATELARITERAARDTPVLPTSTRPMVLVPGLYPDGAATWDPDRAVGTLTELATAAGGRSRVPGLVSGLYGMTARSVAVANSWQLAGSYRHATHYLWGNVGAGTAVAWARHPDELDPARVGADARELARAEHAAQPAPTGRFPMVLAPAAASGLLAGLPALLRADTLGKTPLGRIGAQIGSPLVSIVDDPTMPGALGSAPVDAEAVPTAAVTLVRDGRVEDTLRGRAAGGGAHAQRSSYRALPVAGASNLFVVPGAGCSSTTELLDGITDGLYVTQLRGSPTVDPLTGRFRAAVRGYWIRRRELAFPVRQTAVHGSLGALLRGVTKVGTDLRFRPGPINAGSPSLVVSEFAVSGGQGEAA